MGNTFLHHSRLWYSLAHLIDFVMTILPPHLPHLLCLSITGLLPRKMNTMSKIQNIQINNFRDVALSCRLLQKTKPQFTWLHADHWDILFFYQLNHHHFPNESTRDKFCYWAMHQQRGQSKRKRKKKRFSPARWPGIPCYVSAYYPNCRTKG